MFVLSSSWFYIWYTKARRLGVVPACQRSEIYRGCVCVCGVYQKRILSSSCRLSFPPLQVCSWPSSHMDCLLVCVWVSRKFVFCPRTLPRFHFVAVWDGASKSYSKGTLKGSTHHHVLCITCRVAPALFVEFPDWETKTSSTSSWETHKAPYVEKTAVVVSFLRVRSQLELWYRAAGLQQLCRIMGQWQHRWVPRTSSKRNLRTSETYERSIEHYITSSIFEHI